mgnify:CR=1 FL=1
MVTYHERLSKQLYNIAAAYFMLHIDFTLFVVNVFPDWLGYVFILNALKTIGEEEPSIMLLRPLCIVLIVWEGMKWIAAVLGASMSIALLDIIVLVVQLYLHFQLLTNLANVALRHGSVPSHDNLLIYRTVRTVLATAVYLLTPWMEANHWINIVMLSIYVIAGLLICRDLYCLSEEIRSEGRKIEYTEEIV